MNEEISDYTLQSFYKRKLRESKYAYANKLHSQIWCAVRMIKAPGHTPGVFVLANNTTAKIWGVQTCASPWSCPVCSARRMSKEASRIASAIDALAKWYDEAGFMITFSVPHYHNFSCKQVYEILKETWKQFVHHAKSKSQYDVFAEFANDLDCKHRIRVGEFTWGHYGWHPHYHCLFFVKASKLQKALDWQERLSERWFHCARRATIKILTRDKYCDNVIEFVDDFYSKTQHSAEGKLDAVISLDKDGKVRRAQSADYICGWGADRELTGNVRKEASNPGHYTPHQLLTKAYELDYKGEFEESDKYFRLYVEYALATFKTYRVRMSPDLKGIIAKWRLTEAYTEALKKKSIEKEETVGKWRTVCWFNEKQWLAICLLNLEPQILKFARAPNGKELIINLLKMNDIPHELKSAPNQQWFEREIFNAG